MKKFLIVSGIVVISLVCIATFKDLVIKSVVTKIASRITGAPVRMDRFQLNILLTFVYIIAPLAEAILERNKE